ncbi:MAG: hypothetical protein ACREKL_11805 [Chthoniobacterales bacterium]
MSRLFSMKGAIGDCSGLSAIAAFYGEYLTGFSVIPPVTPLTGNKRLGRSPFAAPQDFEHVVPHDGRR